MNFTRYDSDVNPPGTTVPPSAPGGTRLCGRRTECQALDRLMADVRAGRSRVLVLRGEPGAGKSVLLDYLARRASDAGCRVARATGVQSEMELAFAGLHQLCAPMLDHAESLPGPQRDALRTASGITAGPPDRFLVGLAVLSMLAAMAEERPLICLVDDERWLDRASAQTLGFAARRLGAHPVGLVFAARDPSADLAGLPELKVGGLPDHDARALLASALPGPLDARIRDRIVAETRGNPRALLELPRALTPAQLAGGFGLPSAASYPYPAGQAEDSFARLVDALPAETRQLVRLAAADPSGDSALVWRAAGRLGMSVQAGAAAVDAGLVEFGAQVRFRHPLTRLAAYRSASFSERQQLHAALAEVTDPQVDPDRRAWHRGQAAAGPDEEVALELERSADRAQARGGLAAAAAFLERSVLLTADQTRHAGRILAAAQASVQAGAFGQARQLLAEAEARRLDEVTRARVKLLRAQIVLASGSPVEAAPLLLSAARRLESLESLESLDPLDPPEPPEPLDPLDPPEPLGAELAREAYLSAFLAGLFAGRLAGDGDLLEVCRAARALAPAARPRVADLVLEGLALIVTDGPAAAVPVLRRAAGAFAGASADADITADEALGWSWLAHALWDERAWRELLARQVRLAREAGALGQLPVLLDALGTAAAAGGDFAAASALSAEADTTCQVTGTRRTYSPAAMLVAALRGRHAEAAALIEATIAEAEAGIAVACAHWAAAIVHNGLGRYEEALTAARQASEDVTALDVSMRALPELVEAAARAGDAGLARDTLKQLAEITQPCGTDSALGIEARCQALLSDGAAAEDLYRAAIDRLGRTELRPELARAHLLYGEWLRRENRRADARERLRTAHDMLAEIGMEAFAERARRELVATGETVRKRSVEVVTTLTTQEALIARLACDGRTNPEIGAELFLSGRTVEWHLRKVFTKLGIGSRRELRAALARTAQAA